jgi:hypothetical protein
MAEVQVPAWKFAWKRDGRKWKETVLPIAAQGGIAVPLQVLFYSLCWFPTYLHCLHPVVYHDRWYLAANTAVNKMNQSNCSHWSYFMVATCFDRHMGPSSGILIKYVPGYWTGLMWVHISATYHNHIVRATAMKLQEIFYFQTCLEIKIKI